MQNKTPFDSKGDIFRWGPVPGKFLYVSTFVETHYQAFRAKFAENWSETLWMFKDGRSFWVNNTPDVVAAGQRVFVKYMLPSISREGIYKEWQGYDREIASLEKHIGSLKLSAASDSELLKLWNNFNDLYLKFWVAGSIPELANYGSTEYLTEKLKPIITDQDELRSALEVLTAPEQISFYQEEEIALVNTSDLKKHVEQFYWLKNSYAGTQILSESWFAEHKKEIPTDFESNVKTKLAETAKRKASFQAQYNLPPEIMAIAKAITYGIEWQDERKKSIFIILHYIDVLTSEVARRYKYSFDELHNLWHNQIAEIISGQDLHEELKKRANGFGVWFFHDCRELSSQEVDFYWNLYGTEKSAVGASEVRGAVASKGSGAMIKGVVHILFDPTKVESFKEGEVLVAPMTSPEYVFAMKKACAVLTDTGGLTSHAAITSRELNIPCIVGTKTVTTVFKNGDLVEIDPVKGTAKKV
ncbi:MAG: PEP-utilizing enzyme [Candidatus Magasanikbacteria bacterium]|nr:PEP-utilizing enzyme [Candidatus Magasanikbacteria bacterium]